MRRFKEADPIMRRKPIAEQVVVVMGASTGIGRLAALDFSRAGAKVVLSARGVDSLDELAREIHQAGGTALAIPADATLFEDMEALAQAAERDFGGLDTWVHLAAVAVYAPFDKLDAEEFEQVVRVGLLGQAYGAMAALPIMRRHGGGSLIHVSSVEAEVPLPYHSAYAAAKHGTAGMLDALRMELRKAGVPISVTNIMPASVNTPFFDHARTKLGVKPAPLRPVCDPQAVSDAILRAAVHPRREVVVGGAGRLLVALHRHFPRLVEAAMARATYRSQRNGEPRSPDHESNLWSSSASDIRVRGDEAEDAVPPPVVSCWAWRRWWRARGAGIVGALASVLTGLLAARRARRQRRRRGGIRRALGLGR
jgi:short-subunit dehydrogenase